MSEEAVCTGLGASPGTGIGPVRHVASADEVDRVARGEVIVTEMTTPEMVPAMERAAAIVTDEGGVTCHAAIVSRELGIPAVVGTGDATQVLDDGRRVAVDGERGAIRPDDGTAGDGSTPDDGAGVDGESVAGGELVASGEPVAADGTGGTASAGGGTSAGGDASAGGGATDTLRATRRPPTATEVKVNVSIPSAADRAAATGADGVGLLRLEHILLSLGETPREYVTNHGEEAFVERVAEEVRTVAEAFYPRPVRARTLDAPTDELAELEGGEREPAEHNPMLGWRGVRRSLDESDLVRLELRAFERVQSMGYDNLEVMFPLPNDPWEVAAMRDLLADVGIDPATRPWGTMIETPASVRQIDSIIDTGIDFVALGTNDLVQYVLAVDRNNGNVADRFEELHPAVLEAMGEVIEACNARGVDTTITGQAGSKPAMARFLVENGITSLSANIDAVGDVRDVVARVEQRLTLDRVR